MTSSSKSRNLFRSFTLFSYGLALVTCFGLFFFLSLRSGPTALTIGSKKPDEMKAGVQSRKMVRKDLWLAQSVLERLHNQVESKTSFLTLQPKGSSLEVIERFQDVKGWFLERVQSSNQIPMQQVRYFIAKEGTYSYQDKNFKAEEVSLSIYKIPITTSLFPLASHQAFLKGTAEEISFSFQKESPLFQATRFKASLGGK